MLKTTRATGQGPAALKSTAYGVHVQVAYSCSWSALAQGSPDMFETKWLRREHLGQTYLPDGDFIIAAQ